MNYETILYEVAEPGVLLITLNRPERMNAWTTQMMHDLIDAMKRFDSDDDLRVAIFTGQGKAYCAGADLDPDGFKGAKEPLPAEGTPRDTAGQLSLTIYGLKKPVIAAVNGAAVGVGVTMTLPMDIRIASEKARFGFVFNRRGIVPEGCSTWFLPRIVGLSRASEWIMSGRIMSAREALEGGLVSRVTPPEELLPTAFEMAREIVANTSAISVALSRQMLLRMMGADHPMEAHILESRNLYYMFHHADMVEGVISFMEKRPPKFSMKPSRDMPDFYPWWIDPPYRDK